MTRRFAPNDNFDFADATEAYGDAVEAYENGITFDILDLSIPCISPTGHQFDVKCGPKSIGEGLPLCIHCYARWGS